MSAARRTFLVTGASAGIGAAFARRLARDGYDLVLTARRRDRLDALAEEIRRDTDAQVLVVPMDLAEPDAPERIVAAIADAGHVVDGLVANAGYEIVGNFVDVRWEQHAQFLQVLLTSYVHLTHLVMPGMIERDWGRIVQVASVAGLAPAAPGHTLYSAAKSFVAGFAETLYQETAGTGVHVTALCPGFTVSEFHDVGGTRDQVATIPRWQWSTADFVAAAGLRGVMAGKPRVVTNWFWSFAAWALRVAPYPLALGMIRRRALDMYD